MAQRKSIKKPNKKRGNKSRDTLISELSNKLNGSQRTAVLHGEGPLLIIAGAGTGKTSVITNRISHLILDRGVSTDGMLALTFTEKAAGEMKERVDRLMPMGYVDLWISTFHSFCEKILRLHALDIGLPNEFRLLNQTSQWLLVRKNLDRFNLSYYKPLGNPTKFIHELLKHFSRCKDQEITPESYRTYADTLTGTTFSDQATHQSSQTDESNRIRELAHAYQTYQELLLENDCFDFGDLIAYTLRLFTERPAILRRYQEQFKFILVDEFQDTNHAQYSLVKLLAGDARNITVVGDDDQSIYKFRGASISNIMQFMDDFPDAKRIVLTDNYRSRQGILDLAHNFIRQNDPYRLETRLEGIQKKLRAATREKATCLHLHYATGEDEILGVIKKIVELKKKNLNTSWSDFAILTRSNDAAQQFTSFLRKTDLPHQYLSVRGLYGKPIILDILNYLKLLDNYHESPALYRLLRSPISDLSDVDIAALTHYASKKSISLFECMRRAGEVPGLSGSALSQINELLAHIASHTELAKKKTVSEVVVAFLHDSGYLERLLRVGDEEVVKKNTEYVERLYARLRAFEEHALDPSVRACLDELLLEIESGDTGALGSDIELGPDAIAIMTIHASKGLEFTHVFIPQLVDQRFPTIARGDAIEIPDQLVREIVPEGDVHIQEERRLMYVAITRAKQSVYLTSADEYGGTRKKKISRFLIELHETTPAFTLSEKITPVAKPANVSAPALRRHEARIPAPKHVSFSQIAAFTKCPYQYKLAFIYKIPTMGRGQFSYGKSLHAALQHFFELAHARTDKGQSNLFSKPAEMKRGTIGSLVSFPELLALYEKCWIDDWYETAAIRESYKKQGVDSLRVFYDSVKDKELTVHQLEKPFTIKLAADGEVATIRGVIDRIDIHPDGTAEIIDYKTGKPKTKLDKDDKRQLLLYQLACVELPALTDGAPVHKLTFHYLDNNTQVSFVGSAEELEEIRETFLEVLQNIRDSKFEATPNKYTCEHCDFKYICEYRAH